MLFNVIQAAIYISNTVNTIFKIGEGGVRTVRGSSVLGGVQPLAITSLLVVCQLDQKAAIWIVRAIGPFLGKGRDVEGCNRRTHDQLGVRAEDPLIVRLARCDAHGGDLQGVFNQSIAVSTRFTCVAIKPSKCSPLPVISVSVT